MNLFEKIFNHQIISRVEDSGTFMVTSHERAWLKTMLKHPSATDAFTNVTLDKLRSILEPDQVMDISLHLIEKARTVEKQVYHPLLRTIRRYIMNKTGIRITYKIKGERVNEDHPGFPYKLEYSMIKREWYLLWYHTGYHSIMSTRLNKVLTVSSEQINPSEADRILKKIEHLLKSRTRKVVIEIVPDYNAELSRILYAFSSFEKKVDYDMEADTYVIVVTVLGNETEYLLSKLRFLGKRVRVIKGNYLKRRMLESSTKALERYGLYEYRQ